MSAQKSVLQGSEIDMRELLEGTEENFCYPPGIKMNFVFEKTMNEFVTKPGCWQ